MDGQRCGHEVRELGVVVQRAAALTMDEQRCGHEALPAGGVTSRTTASRPLSAAMAAANQPSGASGTRSASVTASSLASRVL